METQGAPFSREKKGEGQDQKSSSLGPEVSSPLLLVSSCAKGVEIRANVVPLCSQAGAFHWLTGCQDEWDPESALAHGTSACPVRASKTPKRCKCLR